MSKSSFSLLPLPFSGRKYEGEGWGCFASRSVLHSMHPAPYFCLWKCFFSERACGRRIGFVHVVCITVNSHATSRDIPPLLTKAPSAVTDEEELWWKKKEMFFAMFKITAL